MLRDLTAAVVTFAMISAIAACGGGGREVSAAEVQRAMAAQQAVDDRARLEDQKATQKATAEAAATAAAGPPATTATPEEQNTAAQAKHADERAEEKQNGGESDTARNEREGKTARAELQNERALVEADARERLGKASAKAASAQNQSSKVIPARRGRFNTDMTAFNGKKSEVQSRIASLSATAPDQWRNAKVALEKSLEDLENAAARLDFNM